MQGLKSIYLKEGTRGLFRGLGPSVLQVAPLTALQFWSYNVVIEYLLDYTKREWVINYYCWKFTSFTYFLNIFISRATPDLILLAGMIGGIVSKVKHSFYFLNILNEYFYIIECCLSTWFGQETSSNPKIPAKSHHLWRAFRLQRIIGLFPKDNCSRGLCRFDLHNNFFFVFIVKLNIKILGLYKGLYPSVVKSGIATGLHFFMYEQLLNLLANVQTEKEKL